jgi:Golgi phosphoprotein 3 (GPP34)
VARSALSLVVGERDHLPVRDWLLFLARTATADVAGRLAADGYLTRNGGRRPWRGGRWVPVDADTAFAPLVRVKSALRTAGPLPVQNAALGGLATACGLGHQFALWLPPDAGRRLQVAVGDLHPWLRELIAATEATVGAAVLAHRV